MIWSTIVLQIVKSRTILTQRRFQSFQITWQTPIVISESNFDSFRKDALIASRPALMPLRHFANLPAAQRWFLSSEDSGITELNYAYLVPYGDALLPVEYTRHMGQELFHRAKVPFSVFLDWTKQVKHNTIDRFYLAQASISDLPRALQEDLPTPAIVRKAGRGDVYDVNLWIGNPPTYTPLHRDPNPNLFVQLAGQKIVRVLAPSSGQKLFDAVQNSVGNSGSSVFRQAEDMMVGDERTRLEAEIWGKNLQCIKEGFSGYETHLGRGDALFIPQGWWHSIKGVGKGITASVSCKN